VEEPAQADLDAAVSIEETQGTEFAGDVTDLHLTDHEGAFHDVCSISGDIFACQSNTSVMVILYLYLSTRPKITPKGSQRIPRTINQAIIYTSIMFNKYLDLRISPFLY